MISRVMALLQRVELLAIVAGATAVILAVPGKAAANDPVCRAKCAGAFGSSFWAADQFYILNDCGPTGDGSTWCQYVSVN
jgi:hypothetical protein